MHQQHPPSTPLSSGLSSEICPHCKCTAILTLEGDDERRMRLVAITDLSGRVRHRRCMPLDGAYEIEDACDCRCVGTNQRDSNRRRPLTVTADNQIIWGDAPGYIEGVGGEQDTVYAVIDALTRMTPEQLAALGLRKSE